MEPLQAAVASSRSRDPAPASVSARVQLRPRPLPHLLAGGAGYSWTSPAPAGIEPGENGSFGELAASPLLHGLDIGAGPAVLPFKTGIES